MTHTTNRKPPRFAEWLLSHISEKTIRYSALGDFEEQFQMIAREDGVLCARIWYWRQTLRSLPAFLRDSLYWNLTMLKNYLKVTIRNLLKSKSYSFINLAGLSVGLACCMLIFLYVQDELSYDDFHRNAEQIHRITDDLVGDSAPSAVVSPEWGPMLLENFPEVKGQVRIRKLSRFTPLISFEDKRFYEAGIWFADSAFFEMFDFEFLEGSKKGALSRPDAVVITAETARKYFGAGRALGQPLTFDNEQTLFIAGVVRRPANTHLTFDMVRLYSDPRPGRWVATYLFLDDHANPTELEPKLAAFLKSNYANAGDAKSFRFTPRLQALADIHLHSNLQFELGPNSSMAYIYILSAIAILILLVACINFMNLTTARSTQRAREVGLRKVVGAARSQIARQFLGESILMTATSLLLALLIVELVLPAFNSAVGKDLLPRYRDNIWGPVGLAGIALAVGLLAGWYPALFLSSFQPVRILKGQFFGGGGGSLVRKILVVSQFTISIVMLFGTGTIFNQLQFIKNKRLGFNQEHVIAVKSKDSQFNSQYEVAKAELLQHPDIVGASFMQSLPGQNITSFRYTLPGNENEEKVMTAFAVDHDFVETLGIELLSGRDFSKAFGDDGKAFILNEAAAKSLDWNDAVGREIAVTYMEKYGRVVGVVKDFHYSSLHQTIQPAVLQVMPPGFYTMMAIRIRGNNVAETLDFVKEKWEQLTPNYPFEYSFLEEDLNHLYRSDEQLGQIFGYFSLLALLVACMGLFGLAYFSSDRRVQEIGIRKVLGASTPGMIWLLSKDFTLLIIIAFAMAVPTGYLAMSRWLRNFAYRTEIGWELFLLAGILALVISWLTVAYHTIKAAQSNPITSLRYE